MTMTKEDILGAIKSLSVLDLVDLVKSLEDEFGVSAASPVQMATVPGFGDTPEAAAQKAEEQTEFNVLIQEIGPNKVLLIKAVREVTTLGLKEAKELVESAPTNLKEGIGKQEADELKTKLEEVGGVVAVQ